PSPLGARPAGRASDVNRTGRHLSATYASARRRRRCARAATIAAHGRGPMADHDPFPRDRVTATIKRMPAYLRLSWRLARDPLLSRARRAAVVGAAGYLASPIDLVPGVIPVAGQLDDIAVALG